MLRVVPEVETDTHHAVATGHADQKFGLTLAEAREAIARLGAAAWADLQGIHMHIGSQLFDLAPYREAIEAIAGLGSFEHYDLGGGLAVPYTPEQRTPSVDEWVAAVAGAAHELLAARDKVLVIEPGRALVANAGVTLYTVESVKRRESTWVAVDGGMSDNLRPMLYGAPYTADVADRLGSAAEPGERCHLAGKHCESGDVIAWGVQLRDPRPGDVIVTPATGAYGHAHGEQLQRRAAAAGHPLRGRRGAGGGAARDTGGSGCQRRLGSACSATARSARPSRRCSASARTRSSRSPARGPRSPAS